MAKDGAKDELEALRKKLKAGKKKTEKERELVAEKEAEAGAYTRPLFTST